MGFLLYSQESWNENYDFEKVKNKSSSLQWVIYMGWVILKEGEMVGFIVGVAMPYIEKNNFRIEDICISAHQQRKGIGRESIERVTE